MKLQEISKSMFDDFSVRNEIRNFYQTSEYGNWMEKRGYKCLYIGFMDENKVMHAATLIIYKPVFADYKYGYAPRGFLINYTDTNLLREFTNNLKDFLNSKRFAYLKTDPPIIYKSRDKKGNFKVGRDGNYLLSTLKKLGYDHLGFNNYFEALKPRWNAVIRLDKTEDEMFKSFARGIKNKIRSAERRGIEIYKGKKEDIKILYKFIKHKYDRPISYYNDYYDIFKKRDMIHIYMAKLNPYKLLEISQESYEKELEINQELFDKMQHGSDEHLINKKMASDKRLHLYKNDIIAATKLSNTSPEGFVVGGTIVIKYNHQNQFLIDGVDEKYKNLNPNHLLKWEVIKESIKRNDYYIDLNGIVGNFKEDGNIYHGLNQFKLGFNSDVIEYVGEFNLIINPFIYGMIQMASGFGFAPNTGTNKK